MFSTLRFILNHPANRGARGAAVLRYLRWQAVSRLAAGPTIHPWIANVRFFARKGEAGLTGNIYCGLHEFADMAYLLHALRPEDLFVDVGANSGSYTLLASGVVGARTIAVEPVPSTFERLSANIALNALESRVHCLNLGLADEVGTLRFVVDGDTVNRVATGGDTAQVAAIPVRTLDEILVDANPTMIKIDVEGFELPVLKGASKTLSRKSLHSLIVETNGSGRRYGFQDREMFAMLANVGFQPFQYDPVARRLAPRDVSAAVEGNTLFIRGLEAVQQHLKGAPHFKVGALEL